MPAHHAAHGSPYSSGRLADQPPRWPGYGVELFDCDGNSYDAIYWYDFLDAPLMIQASLRTRRSHFPMHAD